MRKELLAALLAGTLFGSPAMAQTGAGDSARDAASNSAVGERLDAAMAMIERQQEQLDRQAAELAELRRLLVQAPEGGIAQDNAPVIAAAQAGAPGVPGDPASVQQAPIPLERVGQAPEDEDRPMELAVLDNQGSVVTRRGQLTGEVQFNYARADRSRAVFRGVELVEAVLVGVFDINESRQDVLTGSASLRYGGDRPARTRRPSARGLPERHLDRRANRRQYQ